MRWNLRLSGPVSAFDVARLLDIEVIFDQHIDIRGFTNPKQPRIWVKDGERDVRMEHACAHELGHHHVGAVDRLGRKDLLESACDRFAAALLLPAKEFASSARQLDLDPLALAKAWPFSSPEAIARRLGEVVPGVLSAKWVEFSARRWTFQCPRAGLARLELEALGDAYLRPRGMGRAEGRAGIARVWRMSSGPRRALAVMQAA